MIADEWVQFSSLPLVEPLHVHIGASAWAGAYARGNGSGAPDLVEGAGPGQDGVRARDGRTFTEPGRGGDVHPHRDHQAGACFGIRELTQVGDRPHELCCRGRTDVEPATGAGLDTIPDRRHAPAMAVLNESGSFKPGWAGLAFTGLLERHAGGEEASGVPEGEPGDGRDSP